MLWSGKRADYCFTTLFYHKRLRDKERRNIQMVTLFFKVCFLGNILQIGGYNKIHQSTLLVMSPNIENFLSQGEMPREIK